MVAGGFFAGGRRAAELRRARPHPTRSCTRPARFARVPGTLSVAQNRARSRGYLVPNETAYANAKASANRRAAAIAPDRGIPSPRSPAFAGAPLRSWQGIDDPAHSPTDSTGAIGTSRYIEMVNSQVAFYDRTNDAPLSTGTLAALAGESGNLFDPQMIWDPGTNRFYYVIDNIVSGADNRLEVGFSKTATPSSTADFCKYVMSTGADFYDYPKLGDTSNLWMVGANVFNSAGSFLRSDVVALTKPAAGSTCPLGSTFTLSFKTEPAPRQRQPGVHAAAGEPDRHQCYRLDRVCRLRFGQLPLGVPGDEERQQHDRRGCGQDGVGDRLLDPRRTQCRRAARTRSTPRTRASPTRFRPSIRLKARVRAWRSGPNTPSSAAPGAEVRWYEINPTPVTPVPFQSGTAGSSALFAFNGAIAPDRRVNGASTQFGSSMVLGFNTSSSTQFINIMAVSKRGTHGRPAKR